MQSHQDTIVAVATAPGRGAIGVVRISGVDVVRMATNLVGALPAPRTASLRLFRDADGCAIDEGIALYFPGPESFTGEDVLELQSHGGTVVLSELIKAATTLGARHARPGEFAERAFLNGKIDLVQAEAIADLIDSSSVQAARAAHNALRGRFSADVNDVSRRITAIRVMVEASIDFPEEAIDPAYAVRLTEDVQSLRARVDSIISKAGQGLILNTGLDVAIVGRPNVGKSTLLNQLAQVDKAIVSHLPGTTRDVISATIQIEALSLRFHDTAGIHDALNCVEAEGVRRALDTVRRSDIILFVTEAGQHDQELLQVIEDNISQHVPVIIIRNKIDLCGVPPSTRQDTTSHEIYLSALTGDGLDLLRDKITGVAGMSSIPDTEYIARQRHVTALKNAYKELAITDEYVFMQEPAIVAEQLRRAQYELGRITGEVTAEDLLGQIFSTFCLGK